MKIPYILSLGFFLSSSLAHLYMSLRSYSLKADKAIGKTLCQIGERWSCDQALTSSFAEIGGIPISNFGFALNLFCFVTLLLVIWVEKRRIWEIWIWAISLGLALGSIVMFTISLVFLDTFCPFCTFCYILSFLVLISLKYTLPFPWPLRKSDFQSFISTNSLWRLATIILPIFLLHSYGLDTYSVREVSKQAQTNFNDWKLTPPSTFKEKPILSSGAHSQTAELHITEFADYLCPFCAKTYFTLKTLQKINPKIKVEYMAFPLDQKGCIQPSDSPSLSCYLWKAVLCAEKQQQGLYLQDQLYNNQSWFISQRFREESTWQAKIQDLLKTQNIDMNSLQQCISSEKTALHIYKHVTEGQKLGVRGTPAMFVEKKKLQPIAIQMTLNKILKSFQNK